jgi:hypothetical protein
VLVGLVLIGTLTFGASSSEGAVRNRCQLWFQSQLQTACWRPFSALSPFNRRLPTRPLLSPANAAVQRHMRAYHWVVQASGSTSTHRFVLDPTDGSRPVYFGSADDPVVTISCVGWYGAASCAGANGVTTDGAQVHVPPGALPAQNWDAHMAIVDTTNGNEYDLWQTKIENGIISAGTGAVENVYVSDGLDAGGDAADLALTGGLLRPSELMSGHIDHALVISVPCTSATGANVGFSWPASGGWGEVCGHYQAETASDAPPIGALFRLNMSRRQIARSHAPKWQKTIETALAQYGAYAEDTNGPAEAGLDVMMQDEISWTSIDQRNQWRTALHKYHAHRGQLVSRVPIPTRRLELVAPCVQRDRCGRPRHRKAHPESAGIRHA